jgi:DNA phosphorothioation-dependent restriction protein DptG
LNYGTGSAHTPFFEKVVAAIAEKFTTPFHRRRGPLGFVPIISNDHLTLVTPAELRIAAENGGSLSDPNTRLPSAS